MTISSKFDYTTPGNYTFDTDEIEISSGTAKLTDFKRIGMNFNQDGVVDSNWNLDGSVTGTLVGGASISAGVLDCRGNQNESGYWTHTVVPKGAVKFKYIPNYNNPTVDTYLVSLTRNFSAFNRMSLFQDAGAGVDGVDISIWDDAGVSVASVVELYANPGFVNGVSHEIELNYDSTTGDLELFIDGVSGGLVNVGPWSRSTEQGRVNLGGISAGATANARFDDLVTYQTVQHTSDYTPGYTVDDSLNGRLRPNAFLPATSWENFESTEIVSVDNSVTYTVIISSDEYYWDGATWALSDSSIAQTSPVADVSANVSTLPIAAGGNPTSYYAYLSTTGSEIPEVDDNTITFDYDVDDIVDPQKTLIFVDSSEIDGATPNVTLRIENETQFFLEDVNFIPSVKSDQSNSEGIASIEIVITDGKETEQKFHFYVDFFDNTGVQQTIDYGYSVTPDALATNISDLTFTSEP